MADVLCDTSFLIHVANRRIKNLENLDVEIGHITFVVPQVVKNELLKLSNNEKKNQDIQATLDYIKNFKTVPIFGDYADRAILDYSANNRIIVATMDKELKKKIKKCGNSVISISNDKIIFES